MPIDLLFIFSEKFRLRKDSKVLNSKAVWLLWLSGYVRGKNIENSKHVYFIFNIFSIRKYAKRQVLDIQFLPEKTIHSRAPGKKNLTLN